MLLMTHRLLASSSLGQAIVVSAFRSAHAFHVILHLCDSVIRHHRQLQSETDKVDVSGGSGADASFESAPSLLSQTAESQMWSHQPAASKLEGPVVRAHRSEKASSSSRASLNPYLDSVMTSSLSLSVHGAAASTYAARSGAAADSPSRGRHRQGVALDVEDWLQSQDAGHRLGEKEDSVVRKIRFEDVDLNDTLDDSNPPAGGSGSGRGRKQSPQEALRQRLTNFLPNTLRWVWFGWTRSELGRAGVSSSVADADTLSVKEHRNLLENCLKLFERLCLVDYDQQLFILNSSPEDSAALRSLPKHTGECFFSCFLRRQRRVSSLCFQK